MASRSIPLQLSEEQVLYFRARRMHLAGAGAVDAVAAARSMLGGQSQQLAPSLLALSLRTQGRPSAETLKGLISATPRRLVRAWGQRETLHLYDPEAHWAKVVAARRQWAPGGRRGPMPEAELVDRALEAVRALGAANRSDLLAIPTQSYVEAVEEIAGPGDVARRFAAGRLIWRLALRGDICHGEKKGKEQAYVPRQAWFPDLPWPERLPAARAAVDLSAAYLAAYGPATTTDVAHFFGARVREAKGWMEILQAESALLPVACGERKGLFALVVDREMLAEEPPKVGKDWPLRLLPLWDAYWMGHKDKSWTVPVEAERKLIWRKAAYVSAVVLVRGRAVATWSHGVKRGSLVVTVQPLGGWRVSRHKAGVRREAKAIARHLGLPGAEVVIEG